MKYLLIALGLAGAIPGAHAAAGNAFPWWFHTRPKSVVLEDQKPNSPSPTTVQNRRTDRRMEAAHFNRPSQQKPPSKASLRQFFTRGWRK
jgi:hypothetical protein